MQLVEAAQHVPLVFSTSLFKFLQDHVLHNSRRDSSSSAHTFPLAIPCVDKISFPWIPHPTPSPYTFWEEKIVQKKNSSILGSFADFSRLAKSTPVVLSGFPFLIIGFWQRVGGERSLSATLHRTMNFLHHLNVSVECLSDSLQQILKYDNGPQKWLMVSSSWFHFPDPLHPLACVPRLIRNQGFSLISWWVSCSTLSQICCLHYLFQPRAAFKTSPLFFPFYFLFFSFWTQCFVITGLGLLETQAFKKKKRLKLK